MFTKEEADYVRSQRLARVATVAPDGQPDVDAVGFRWDGEVFLFGGLHLLRTRKAKNIAAGARKVSLIIDDIDPDKPEHFPRGIKIHGIAEIREGGERPVIAIRPVVSWSWGILDVPFAGGTPRFHRIEWAVRG